MVTALVTGSSRGLGLELVRQLLQKGFDVAATCRSPESSSLLQQLVEDHSSTEASNRLLVLPLDVCVEQSVKEALIKLRDEHGVTSLDLLFNNAGIAAEDTDALSTSVGELELVLRANTIGPLLVTQIFLPLLKKDGNGSASKVIFLSSRLGSLALADKSCKDRSLSYMTSKAALNMLTRRLAAQVENVIFLAITPGWVATDMGCAGGRSPPLKPAESVVGILKVVDRATINDSGKFFGHEGDNVEW